MVDLFAKCRLLAIGQDDRAFQQITQDSPLAVLEEQTIFVEPFICNQILVEIETNISIGFLP